MMPREIYFDLTNKCNLKCTMCFFYGIDGIVPDTKGELSFEGVKKVIGNIYDFYDRKELPCIILTGGEPMLKERFPDIIKYIDRKGFKIRILTNGTLINGEVAEALSTINDIQIRISLDGIGKIHDTIRGCKGTFGKVSAGIKLLKKYIKEFPCKARLNAVISRDSVNSLKELVVFAAKQGVKIQFQHLNFITDDAKDSHKKMMLKYFSEELPMEACGESLIPDPFALEAKIREIMELSKELSVDVFFLPDVPLDRINDYYTNYKGYAFRDFCSNTIFKEIRLDSKGNIFPCMLKYKLGNLLEESFSDILKSERAKRFVNFLSKEGLFPGCRRCCML